MNRLIKFTWFLTTLLFLGVLLWEYAYLPQNVGILADPEGAPVEFISRENLFYVVLAIFSFSNAVIFALRKLILVSMQPNEKREVPGKAGLKYDLSDWLLAFAASLNIFLIFGIIYLGFYNNSSGINLSAYGPLVYGGPIIMGILFLVLIYILLKKRD